MRCPSRTDAALAPHTLIMEGVEDLRPYLDGFWAGLKR
jgi:hypothetical protein